MFLVDNNVGLVAEACNRVIVLATGVIIFDGTPQDALTDSEVKSAYLGDATFGKVSEVFSFVRLSLTIKVKPGTR